MPQQIITNSRAIERTLVAELLRGAGEGAVVSYAEISGIVGFDIRAARHILTAACRELRDEDGMIFRAETNIGLRRLTNIEAATDQPDWRRRRAFRQSNIALKEMATVRAAELAPGDLVQFNARVAQHAAIAAISTTAATKKLIEVSRTSAALPVDQTLAMLQHIK